MEAFLKRVLPDGGEYVLMTIDPARPRDKPRHVNGIKTVGSMVAGIQRLSLHPLHVYFAVGSYDGDRNKPRLKRCLFLDLDQKEFTDKSNAARELGLFCKTVGFPTPSIVVDSGRGLHVYWCFTRDLDPVAWKALAGKLKQKCKDVGFKVDEQCTADQARVLRVPGTLNYKETPPVPCRVVRDTGKSYDPAGLLAALMPATSSPASILSGSVGDDLARDKDGPSFPNVPYFGIEIASRCGVMKDALDSGGKDHIEPLWSNLLSLLTYCEDADVLVPLISKEHPGYDAETTLKKFEYKKSRKAEGNLKPVLCTTFEQYKTSICAGCQYKDKIRTPLVLGKQESVSFLPLSYVMKPNGIFKIKKGSGPDEPDTVSMAFPYSIGDVDLLTTGSGYMVKATYTSSHNLIRTEMPLILFADQGSELAKTLMQAGVIAGMHAITELKHIMTHWLKKLQDIKEATKSQTTNMGWGSRSGEEVFAAGAHIFHKDGKVDTFTHPETQLLKDYEPIGKREVWDHAAKAVLADGRPSIAATVLTAFCAPLMKMTGAPGITFSVCSIQSGTGKTTALKLAQSVWAHPVRAMAMLDDTPNSLMKKVGFINSLPAYWDEVRLTKDFDVFIQMIFQLAQGKEKARLTSSVRQQEMGTWKTLCVMATNERIVDHVDHIVRASNSGRLRVFEVQIPSLAAGGADSSIGRDIDKLETNFGHAGQQYAKFLAMHREKVEQLVHTIQDRVATDLSALPEERFWTAFVASELAACALVNQLGILTIDQAALKKWLYSEFLAQRMGVRRNYLPADQAAVGAVMQYAEFYRDQFVVTEFAGGKRGYGALLVQPISKEIVGLLAKKEDKLRIKEAHFKEWVHSTLQHSPTVLIGKLTSMGVAVMKKASVTAGIANTTSARFSCIEIDLTNPLFSGLREI